MNRYSTVQKTLLKDNAVFTFEDGLDNQQMFGLVTNDLTLIKPNYEAMVKGGTLRITDEGYAQGTITNMFAHFILQNIFNIFYCNLDNFFIAKCGEMIVLTAFLWNWKQIALKINNMYFDRNSVFSSKLYTFVKNIDPS